MIRFLIPVLLLLLLGACASVPDPETPQIPVPQDFSRPNAYSVYHYLSGSFAGYSDQTLAIQQYQKALSYDPASPQIKQALLRANIASFLRFPIEQEQIVQQLLQAREEKLLTDTDLIDAMRVFTLLQNAEGIEWVINDLEAYQRSANAQLIVYNHRFSQSGVADKKKVKSILDIAVDKSFAAYILASIHAPVDPDFSLELLSKYPGDPRGDEIMLDILISKQDLSALSRVFEHYQYPEDSHKMLMFMSRMQQQQQGDIVTQNGRKIIYTRDKALIATYAEIAFFADAGESIHEISRFLIAQPWEPTADAQIAAVLLAYAIQHEDHSLPLEQLCERVTSLDRAYTISHYYLYKNLDAFTASNEEAKAGFDRRAQALIPDPILRDLLLSINYQRNEDADNQASLLFARSLMERNLAGKEEYTLLLADLHQQEDDQELISTLRQAIRSFPNEALFLNDLGYTLLSHPEHLDEADILITKALELMPGDGAILDSMAWLKYIQGDFQTAAIYADRIKGIFELDKLDPEVLYHLGMIHLAVNDVKAAIDCLEALPDPANHYHQMLKEAIDLAK